MEKIRAVLRCVLASLFVAAGVNHFRDPGFYLKIMPPYLPFHLFLVYLSGFFEVALGLLLFVRRYARPAAWGIVALLVAVTPANLHMALNPELYPEFGRAALWLRLPLQGVLIAWAYWHTRPDARANGARQAG